MTDEAFLQAILDNPDDDAVRLVYNDWLEEHGQPDRAAFIRVQIALNALPDDDPRRPELEARERQLLGEYGEEWARSLGPWATGWTFRRGFIEAVKLPAQAYLDHAAALRRRAPVRRFEVDLTEVRVPETVLGVFPGSMARGNLVLPFGQREARLVVAMPDPDDLDLRGNLQSMLARDIEPVAAPLHQIVEAINRHYGQFGRVIVIAPDFDDMDQPDATAPDQ
jgi:uncharacterized protein (TIGR02996 family)